MKSKAAKLIVGAGILLLSTQFPAPLHAQVGGVELSGTVTDPSGKVVSNAKVSVRDLHMLQVTRGGEFPIITVRTRLPEEASASATIHADLEIQFAGQTVAYAQVAFERVTQKNETRISGTIPATLSAFKIDPPSLFAITVKNEMPVRVEMTWRREN